MFEVNFPVRTLRAQLTDGMSLYRLAQLLNAIRSVGTPVPRRPAAARMSLHRLVQLLNGDKVGGNANTTAFGCGPHEPSPVRTVVKRR